MLNVFVLNFIKENDDLYKRLYGLRFKNIWGVMNCLYAWTDINLVYIGLNLWFLLKNEFIYDEMNKL